MANKPVSAESVEIAAYPAPDGLSDRAVALWRAVVPSRGVTPGRLAMVSEALRALDRADQCRRIVDAEGVTFRTDSGTIHVHPAVKVERESRQMFAKLWREAGLDWNPRIDGAARTVGAA